MCKLVFFFIKKGSWADEDFKNEFADRVFSVKQKMNIYKTIFYVCAFEMLFSLQ